MEHNIVQLSEDNSLKVFEEAYKFCNTLDWKKMFQYFVDTLMKPEVKQDRWNKG